MTSPPEGAADPTAAPAPAAAPSKAETAEPFPDDLADWKKEDYLRARKAGNKRLAEAAMHLAERFAGTDQADSAAQLLGVLLKPLTPEEKAQQIAASRPAPTPSPEMSMEQGMAADPTLMGPPATDPEMSAMSGMDPGMGYGQPQPGTEPALIKAIIYALGATRSNSGRDVLKQVLAGTYEVENDRVASVAALESLAFYNSPENEAILMELVATPESVRKVEKAAEKTPEAKPAQAQPSQPARPPGFETSPAPVETSAEMAMEMSGAGAVGPGQQGRGDKMSPTELQQGALALVQKTASEQLRTKIAGVLANKAVPETIRAEVGKFLLEKRPDNAPAQMLLYRNEVLDSQTRESIVGYFISYSSDALGAMMGIPPGVKVELPARQVMPGMSPGMPGMEPSMPMEAAGMAEPVMPESGMSAEAGAAMAGMEPGAPGMSVGAAGFGQPKIVEIDAALGYRIASQLWSGDFARVVAERLDGVESLAVGGHRIAMASTMPSDGMRAKLYELLNKHSLEGPAALEASGLLDNVIFEPGFLAVVKSLPREEPSATRTPAAASSSPRRPARGGRATGGDQQGGNEVPEWQKRQQASQAWMQTSESLVRVLCGRLAAAGEKQFGLGDAQATPKPPMDIATDAEITAQFNFEWPTEAAKQLAGSGLPQDTMKVQYLRLKQFGKPKTILGFYRRKMNQPVIHERGHECWAESFRNLPQSDRKLNVDLLVTAPQLAAAQGQPGQMGQPEMQQPGGINLGAAQPADSQETEVVVEILLVEVKDPAPRKEK